MKFYPSDWMSDPRLRACRADTRGVWMDLLSTMWLHGAGELVMTAKQVGRICGTSRSETLNALRDLQLTGTADLDPPLGSIAPPPKTAFKIMSRRIARTMSAMTNERSRFRERTNRKRGIADNVTVESRSDSGETPPLDIDKSKTKKLDPPVVPLPGDRARKPRTKKPDPVEAHREHATLALVELNAARKRVNTRATGLDPLPGNLKHIAGRLAAGYTLANVLHVIAVREAECRRKPDSYEWFDAVTPFREDSFTRALGGDPQLRVVERGEPARAEPLPFDQVFNGYKDQLR